MNTQSFPALRLITATALAATLAACGGSGDDPADIHAGWQSDGNVKLEFAAYNGSTPITCDSSLALGPQASAVKVQDFRFYVADVQLVSEDGSKVPLTLKQTDDYNYVGSTHSVSLIDLEQFGQGECQRGTAALNASIEGTVPAGYYTGVELTLGVPMELNHLNSMDPATPAVLRTDVHPGMSWSWRGGRKFTKIEFAADPASGADASVLLHLGSSGCVGDPANGTPITSCVAPNRGAVALTSFDPAKNTIAVDAGALFNYDFTGEGQNMCMSGPTDTACETPFQALALDWKSDGTGTGLPLASPSQAVFKAVAR